MHCCGFASLCSVILPRTAATELTGTVNHLLIYKIFRPAEWAEVCRTGTFVGSPDDMRDGFIHLSCGRQLAGTAARHFRGEPHLVLAAVETAALGDRVRWEPSRSGEIFPHLYGPLDLAAVHSTVELALGPDGIPLIPTDVDPC
jgi:uncharacterized protein (DUF952 family)